MTTDHVVWEDGEEFNIGYIECYCFNNVKEALTKELPISTQTICTDYLGKWAFIKTLPALVAFVIAFVNVIFKVVL